MEIGVEPRSFASCIYFSSVVVIQEEAQLFLSWVTYFLSMNLSLSSIFCVDWSVATEHLAQSTFPLVAVIQAETQLFLS